MFDGLLLFRPLSPILSESDMTEPDTMTYIRAGSCVRTCSSIRIYVWPDATVCVARCVRTHFTNRGICQNVDNAVFWFVGARFSFYTLPCCKKDLDVFKKDLDVS